MLVVTTIVDDVQHFKAPKEMLKMAFVTHLQRDGRDDVRVVKVLNHEAHLLCRFLAEAGHLFVVCKRFSSFLRNQLCHELT